MSRNKLRCTMFTFKKGQSEVKQTQRKSNPRVLFCCWHPILLKPKLFQHSCYYFWQQLLLANLVASSSSWLAVLQSRLMHLLSSLIISLILPASPYSLTCFVFNSNSADLSGFSNNNDTYSPAVVWICPPRVLTPPWERLVSPWKQKVTWFMLTLVPPSIPFQSFNLGTVSRQRSPFNLHRGDRHKGTESPAPPASSLSVRQRWHAKQSH